MLAAKPKRRIFAFSEWLVLGRSGVAGFGRLMTIMRAAAWDAQLADVEAVAFRVFEEARRRRGHYVVLMQTPEWEFLTGVKPDGSTLLGEIQQQSFPTPPHVGRPV